MLAMICVPALLFLWISSRGLLFDTLNRIENIVAEDQLRQTYSQLDFYIKRMEQWGQDWAYDKSLIEYLRKPNQKFEQDSFPEDLLIYNRSHLVVFLDAKQKLLFGRFMLPNSNRVSELPQPILEQMQEKLRHHQSTVERDHLTGIFTLAQTPAMLTMRAVFDIENQGHLAGYLVFAEYFDTELLSRISGAMGYLVSFEQASVVNVPTTEPSLFMGRSERQIDVSRALFGIEHNEQYALSVHMDRSAFLSGAEGVERYLILTFATVLAMIAVLYLFIRQYVSAPVSELTKQVEKVDADGFAFSPVDKGNSRELKILVAKFNGLMARLFQEKQKAQTTLASIGDAVISVNEHALITYVSPVAESLFNTTASELEGRSIDQLLISLDGRSVKEELSPLLEAGECQDERILRRISVGDRCLSLEQSISPLRNHQNEINGAVLVLRDVSATELLKQKLAHQSEHDPVTGLYTRGRFEQLLGLLDTELATGEHAICYLDLDNFKLVNDNCGHGVGDRLLREISDAIRHCIRDSDLLARIGGDEFVLVLKSIEADAVTRVVEKIAAEIETVQVYWGSTAYSVGASIGVSFLQPGSSNLRNALQEADAACRSAKLPGSNNICFYDPENPEQSVQRQAPRWAVRINDAIEQNKLELYYQEIMPLHNRGDGRRRIEVLVRMIEQGGELLLPDSFLPAAERYHLCEKLDHWVLEQVYAWLARHPECWNTSRLCVNVSTETLASDKFESVLRTLSSRYKVPAESLCFEITERAAIRNPQKVIDLLTRLRLQGYRFALDDFGSGFSSYGYLKHLPVDMVKIDGGFIRTLNEDPKDLALVQSIHEVCAVHGMQTVAEYVESDEVYERVSQIGIDYAQGFSIGRPKPLSEFTTTGCKLKVV
ncbi:cyclic di-GMP phosphodiesterase PdeB [Corallincola platygyrae]